MPAPSASDALIALFASTIFLSSIVTVVELMVVTLPRIVKLPWTIKSVLAVIIAAVISSLFNCPFTVTLLKVTEAVGCTFCPIAIVGLPLCALPSVT